MERKLNSLVIVALNVYAILICVAGGIFFVWAISDGAEEKILPSIGILLGALLSAAFMRGIAICVEAALLYLEKKHIHD